MDRDLEDTLRTEDGTILPRTVGPDTGGERLLRELPRLDQEGVARDLILGETIGRGGMGVVRVAEQRAIGRRVAVKQLASDHAADRTLALYLLREAWVTGALEHPNIIPIHGIGADAHGGPMIVMKRVEGRSWSTVLHEGAHDLRWHLRILLQVCSAVDFATSRGIVHRDLKPDNVMIGSFGEVYVLDWGIAVSLHDDHGGRIPLARDAEGVCGTPGYLAPEMVGGTPGELSGRTDVYLLGSILHELITKERRHQGTNLHASLMAALESREVEYPAHIPPELSAIAHRAGAREPEDRYASAGAMRAAIEQFLEHESSRELVDQAEQRLEAWAQLGDASGRPLEVQRLFGEANFAFQQALRAWPANERARAGRKIALRMKLEHDLARDDFDSAAVVLEELGESGLDLATQLEVLRARMESRRAELGDLRKLKAGRDLDVGRRTRALLVVISAITFGITPPLALWLGFTGDSGYAFFYAAGAIKIAGGFALQWWAWDTLSKTAVNRQLTATVQLMMWSELGIHAFTQSLGRQIENALFTDFGVYFLVTTTVAITLDRRLLVCAAYYVVGAFLTNLSMPHVFWTLGGAHLAAGLTAAWIWRPSNLRGPDRAPQARRLAA